MRKFITIIFILLIGGYGIGLSAAETAPLELDVYPGPGSILIVWDQVKDMEPDSILVYRAETLTETFTLLAVLTENTDRYLDTTAQVQKRYFYYIEIKSRAGNLLTSSRETPAFTRIPVEISDPAGESSVVIPKGIRAWFARGLEEARHQVPEHYAGLFTLLNRDSLKMDDLWEALSPLQALETDLESMAPAADSLLLSLEQFLAQETFRVRNMLRLTPDEYDRLTEDFITSVKQNLDQLKRALEEYQSLLISLPQVRIDKIVRSSDDSVHVTLQVITFRDHILSLTDGEQEIAVTIPDSLNDAGEFRVTLPSVWTTVILRYQDIILDQRPVPAPGDGYTISLLGDMFPLGYTREAIPIINELQYNPVTDLLQIEIFIPANVQTSFSLTIADSVYWQETVMTGIEPGFLDSTLIFAGQDSVLVPWVMLWETASDTTMFADAYLLPDDMSIQMLREPDGRAWAVTNQSSFGKSNRSQDDTAYHLAVPEVFALYQNYPNPFNSGTTIAFDLLLPATVTLYVTNAAGRVIETFLLQTPMNVGHYTYQWFGHQHASGLYFYTITAEVENFLPVTYSRKMIYLK